MEKGKRWLWKSGGKEKYGRGGREKRGLGSEGMNVGWIGTRGWVEWKNGKNGRKI